MNELIKYFTPNEKKEIRVILDEKGEPRWVAKDVAEALGYEWKGTSSVSHVPQEWRGVYSVQTPSGMQEMITFSEPGLYFFLARSDKPAALPFQKWIARDILPSLRKEGQYSLLEVPKTLPTALRAYALEIEKREAVERDLAEANKHLEVAAPKETYFDMVALSPTCHKIGDFAKMIDLCLPDHATPYGKPGQVIGPNIMFRILKGEKFLLHNRVPYQDHRDHFDLKQKPIPMGKDSPCELIPVSVISVAGQLAVLKKLQDMGCTPRKKKKALIPSGFTQGQIGLVKPRAIPERTETADLPLETKTKETGEANG